MYKIRDNRWNRRFCKWMASFLMAALLVNQSSILTLAEETVADTVIVTDEGMENLGAGEETKEPDAGEDEDTEADTDTAPDIAADEETDGSDAGEGEDADADIDSDTDDISDVDAGDQENTLPQAEEAGNASREDAVSRTVEDGFPDFTDNGCQYRIISEENLQVELWRHSASQSTAVTLEIPIEAWDGAKKYTVVRIGDKAFSGYHNLESITIPDSITSIGPYAFFYCDNLKSITIPNSVTKIEEYAFQHSGIENIVIPNSVTSIENDVFSGCKSLSSITIPDSVTSIGDGAFWGCSGLTSITIPNSVTSIGWCAFVYCTNLKEVIIPDSVTSIGSGAFNNCGSLTGITIPSGVTSIEDTTFMACKSLTSITIPNSITSIGQDAFWGCENLESVTILNDNIILADRAFCNCQKLSSLQIVITEGSTVNPPTVGSDCFALCLGDSLTFLMKDGTELSDTTLATAVKAYDVADGDEDGKWFEWILPDAPDIPVVTEYQVTISVEIDDNPWSDCGKTFALSADPDHKAFITNLTAVPAGTYTIFDITGATDSAGYVNTGVFVEVKDSDVEVTVKYYTVTFYDGENVLGGQIVPREAWVNPPSDTPTKDGYTFYRWATSEDGSTEFDFKKPITAKADIYASWIVDEEKLFTITASAGTGGSVSPSGDVKVKSGADQRFTITPQEGYRVSSVLVDNVEQLSSTKTAKYVRAEITDAENNVKYYDFENVTGDHTLAASFEAIQGGDGDDSGTGDGDDGGSGDDTGGGGDSGSGGTGGGGNSDSGSIGGDADSNDSSGDSLSVIISDMSVASDAGIARTSSTTPASQGREPKTGDVFHMEIYATIAMIAGLFYILLSFVEGKCGMTEEEKQEVVAALMNWAKKGDRVRKYAALAVIFLVLVYYHSIGKRTSADWKEIYENEKGMVSNVYI